MLYIGEEIGTGNGKEVDIDVDPLEGKNIVAKGLAKEMAVIAIADKGNLLHAPDMYIEKIADGPNAAGKISLDDPIETTIEIISDANNKTIRELKVIVQERERHRDIIERVLAKDAR